MEYQPGIVATYVSLKLGRMRQEDSFELKTSRSPSHPRIQVKDVSQRGGRGWRKLVGSVPAVQALGTKLGSLGPIYKAGYSGGHL